MEGSTGLSKSAFPIRRIASTKVLVGARKGIQRAELNCLLKLPMKPVNFRNSLPTPLQIPYDEDVRQLEKLSLDGHAPLADRGQIESIVLALPSITAGHMANHFSPCTRFGQWAACTT